jgi:hypothetical protein
LAEITRRTKKKQLELAKQKQPPKFILQNQEKHITIY